MASILQLQRLATCTRYRPDYYHAWCAALAEAGPRQGAEAAFDRWRAADPGNHAIDYFRSALLGDRTIRRAPDAYVEQEFDSFADSFDAVLEGLGYRVPQLFAALLKEAEVPVASARALDLGCGTGLCGLVLRPYARELVGVDLSGGMIEYARERGVYDALVTAEIEGWLAAETSRFDLVAAGDSLIYFADLAGVFAGIRHVLAPGGLIMLTLEAGEERDAVTHAPHGRFQHGRDLVAGLLADARLDEVTIAGAELRYETGVPVAGLLVSAWG